MGLLWQKGQLQGEWRRAGVGADRDLPIVSWPQLHQFPDVSEEIPWAASSGEHHSFQGGTWDQPWDLCVGVPKHTCAAGMVCVGLVAFLVSCDLSWMQGRAQPQLPFTPWPLGLCLFSPCVAVVFAAATVSELCSSTWVWFQPAVPGNLQLQQSGASSNSFENPNRSSCLSSSFQRGQGKEGAVLSMLLSKERLQKCGYLDLRISK